MHTLRYSMTIIWLPVLLLRGNCQSDCHSLLQCLSFMEKKNLTKVAGKGKMSNVYLAILGQTKHQGKQVSDMRKFLFTLYYLEYFCNGRIRILAPDEPC